MAVAKDEVRVAQRHAVNRNHTLRVTNVNVELHTQAGVSKRTRSSEE